MKIFGFYVLMAVPIIAFAQLADQSQDREQRNQEFLRLNRQIFPAHTDAPPNSITDPDQILRVRTQLNDLVAQSIKATLLTGTSSAVDVSSAIKALQGNTAPSSRVSNTPFSGMFTIGGFKNLAVAYVIPEGNEAMPDTHPHLEFYILDGGEWKRKAEAPTETDFKGCTFFISEIQDGSTDDILFLVSGFEIGDTGTRLRVRLYSYDGVTTHTVWQRNNLTGGKISTAKDVISLDYDLKYNSSDPFNRIHEEFRVGKDGVNCISASCQ